MHKIVGVQRALYREKKREIESEKEREKPVSSKQHRLKKMKFVVQLRARRLRTGERVPKGYVSFNTF